MSTTNQNGTALVTGASSGIGEIYAERLARRGYDLILVARNVERLNGLAGRLRAATGRSVDTIVADLSITAEVESVEQRLRVDPVITLLVNNAGLMSGGPVASADPSALALMLAVNVTALTRLSAAAASAFTGRGRGAIVNVASAMAFIDTPRTAAYGASKAYVLNFSLALDAELRPQGVQVQAVLPGYTKTPMIDGGANLPAAIVMDAGDLVDAALAGFDQGELVTIPSLPNAADFDRWEAARADLRPHLSLDRAAERYLLAKAAE